MGEQICRESGNFKAIYTPECGQTHPVTAIMRTKTRATAGKSPLLQYRELFKERYTGGDCREVSCGVTEAKAT